MRCWVHPRFLYFKNRKTIFAFHLATLGAQGAEQGTKLLPYNLKHTKQLRMTIWQKLKDLWFCRALSRMIMKPTSPVTLNNLLHHGMMCRARDGQEQDISALCIISALIASDKYLPLTIKVCLAP